MQSLMTTNFVTSLPIQSVQDARNALANTPDWILISDNDKHALLAPGDLHSIIRTNDNPEEQINLLEIPALRMDTATISTRATLQQALELMTDNSVDALCVTNYQDKIVGLLTRDQIENFYRQS